MKSARDVFTPNGETIETLLRAAADHYGTGDYARAEKVLLAAAHLDDKEVRTFRLLGSVLFLQKRYTPAEEAYEKAQRLKPDEPYTLVALAELKLLKLKYGEAMSVFKRLREIDPDGAHPASGRARVLLNEHQRKLGTG